MDTFEALADVTRRSIIERLAQGDLNAGTIAGQFEISRPAISRHLRVLREAGLVSYNAQAQQRVYHLERGAFAEVREWIARYDQFWESRLNTLTAHLEHQHLEGRT